MDMMEIAGQFRRREWEDTLPGDLFHAEHVPTMLTPAEQRLYFWMAKTWGRADGAIVDLGSFVGGSTARLALGAQSGAGSQVHAFDRFNASEKTKANQLYPHGIPEFEGDDILPLSQKLLTRFAPKVTFYKGEIQNTTWNGGPIDVLTMDASKEPRTMDAMAETFFPSLMPGRSFIVQQDFLHWRQPWVPAQMEMWADHVVPLANVPDDTVVFLVTKAFEPGALQMNRVDSLDDQGIMELVKGARRRYRQFLPQERLTRSLKSLKANPGVRIAWKMKPPAE